MFLRSFNSVLFCCVICTQLFADSNTSSDTQKTIPMIEMAKFVEDNRSTLSQLLKEYGSVLLNDSNISFKHESKASLKYVVQTAIRNNYRVKQAKERVLQAEHLVSEAKGDFLPQVSLNVTGYKKDASGYDRQRYEQISGDMVVSYNIFASGLYADTLAKSRLTKKEQEERLRLTIEEETLKLIDAYFSVVFGKLSVEANKNNYEKLLKILEIVKIKRDLGAATGGDESSIQASVSNAKTALINTESSYTSAKDYYEFLINDKIDFLYPYQTEFDIKLNSYDEVFDDIKQNSTDLMIIKTQIKGKQKDVSISRAMDLPKLDLTITGNRKYRNDLMDPNFMGNNREISVELVLSYNLYTGGKTEARVARSLSEVSGLVYGLEYATQEAKWNSQKLFNSVHANSKTLETLKVEIEASKRMANAYWEKFRLSSQDLAMLLQAQRQVNTAELERLRIEKTRLIDYFNLMAKQGKLLEYFGIDK